MNIKDTHTQLALALLIGLLLCGSKTTIAVVNPGQYSRYPTQSYYSQSLPSYGNEHQNYFDNTGELDSTSGYSNEPYRHQQYPTTGYASSGGGRFDDGGNEQSFYGQQRPEDSHLPYPRFQDSISESYSAFRQEQDAVLDSFDRPYSEGAGTSSLVPFDNIDFNNSETTRYQATEDDIYPELDSRPHQQPQKHRTPARQYHAESADYMTANNNVSPSIPSRMNSLQSSPYLYEDGIQKDSALSSNTAAVAQMTVTAGRLPPSPPAGVNQMHARNQMNERPYTESENQRDQHHIPRTSQRHHPPQYESQFSRNNDRVSNSSSSRTYYVADSDLSTSTSNQLDTESLSVLQSHLVQLPAVSSSSSSASHSIAPSTNYGIPSDPIPISKHVEITKHIPIPVYRQIHVPYRKPVRIEIPRPVINTVPRPYPIHIPNVVKPVVVPMVREVKIPVEKVTPYPVEHKVPYVVEKRVPFQIEKQVAAPVYYPFPVRVPMVRTIVHKKKSHLAPLRYRPRIHI